MPEGEVIRLPVHPRGQLDQELYLEDLAMSFILNGYAVSTPRRFLGLLFFVVLGLLHLFLARPPRRR